MAVRGVRGATVVDSNTREAILAETTILLSAMIEKNGIRYDDIASAFFSMTSDLDAEFPAIAARELGMNDVPLLCLNEIAVPGSLGQCIRILLHWNTDTPARDIIHPYLRDAARLRPDKCPQQ